jgi:hypothetical protein
MFYYRLHEAAVLDDAPVATARFLTALLSQEDGKRYLGLGPDSYDGRTPDRTDPAEPPLRPLCEELEDWVRSELSSSAVVCADEETRISRGRTRPRDGTTRRNVPLNRMAVSCYRCHPRHPTLVCQSRHEQRSSSPSVRRFSLSRQSIFPPSRLLRLLGSTTRGHLSDASALCLIVVRMESISFTSGSEKTPEMP